MFKNRLAYKFLIVFIAFAIAVITPLALIIYSSSNTMISDIEKIEPLLLEQRAVQDNFKVQIIDSFVSLVFYIFILSFIASLFLSRRFIMSVKELYRGAMSLKEGNLDIRLDIKTDDEMGEVTRSFNDMADTLKQKTSELQRKDTYVNTMLDPLWVVDMDNIIIDINPAFTKLFGYERDEVIGVSIYDFLDEENEKIMRSQLQKRDKGMAATYAISIISKKEGLMPVLISGAPIIENKEVVGKLGIIKDFRSEVALRDALREEKDHSEAIMDSLIDILLVIDKDLRIIKANKAAISSAGEDITGKFCHNVFHKLHSSCYMMQGLDCPVKIVFETGKNYKTVHEHTEVGEVPVFHEITAYPVKNREGEVVHVVELMRDITETKKFEDEIAQRNKELMTLNNISRILSQSLKAEDIFNSVLGRVIDMLGMDGGGIFFLDEMGRELICRYQKGSSEEFMKSIGRIRVGEDILGRVAVVGQGVVITDILKDIRVEKSILKHSGIRGLACIPIKGKEKLIGVFYIFSFKPHIFAPEEERILHSIGEMTGIAFENIRLYEKMRELYDHQKERRTGEQRDLLKLASLLTGTLDIKAALKSTILALKEISKADFVWLLEPDDIGNLVLSSASQEGPVHGEIIYSPETSAIERYVFEKRKPIVFAELLSESRFYISAYVAGYNTACSIPIYIGDKTLGAFTLYYRSFAVPSEEDIFSLQTTSSILAIAMERARLYEEVLAEKGMADTILESLTDGIMTVDISSNIISTNRAVRQMTEIYADVTGHQCCNVFGYTPENTELRWKLGECFEEALQGKTSRGEAELISRMKKVIPLRITSAPVFDKQGKVTGVVYVLRDVSSEREMDKMKTDFVKAVSHEFRTPLSAIVGMTEMLMDEGLKGDREKDYLNTILAEGRRLSNMVSDILDVARIESGKEVFKEEKIDFNAMLKGIEAEFDTIIRKKEIGFSLSVEKDTRGYSGDSDKIKQLLKNLVDNALTYSDKGCKVEVTVRRHDEMIQIVVKDSGWGIAEEDISHIGEKFYRGRYAAKTKGTGLGISLTREIAHLHGGEVQINSAFGKGTTVIVELPERRK